MTNPPNPATAAATVMIDELVRGGVRDVVLAPGSRSAPLAFAALVAAEAGRVRLHVRIDERSAAFLALGIAKSSRRPVPVVTTSGTAVANLHPAVLEASHAGVPLVVLTADRPAGLRGTNANQTTDQVRLFGSAVRFFADVPAPYGRPGESVDAFTTRCLQVADDRADAALEYERLRQRQVGELTAELRMRHASGTWRWIELLATNAIGGGSATDRRSISSDVRRRTRSDGAAKH